MSSQRERGTIKWFNSKKGFGFAIREDQPGSPDVFVHINNLPDHVDDLKVGQAISFVTETTRKGTRAVAVLLEQ